MGRRHPLERFPGADRLVASLALGLILLIPGAARGYTATFTNMAPASRPSARTGPSFTRAPLSPEVLFLFGGSATLNTLNDLWTYTPSTNTWTQLSSSNAPSKRAWFGAGWDTANSRLIVYGGLDGVYGNVLGDLHIYDPATTTWTQATMAGDVPAERWQMVFRYVEHLGRFFVFSGATGRKNNALVSSVDQGMWWLEIDASTNTATWTSITPSGTLPPGRAASCNGYDQEGHRIVVFGGEIVDNALADTWQYDLDTNTWTQDSPTGTLPTKRLSSNCAFDPRTGQLLMHGGTSTPSGSLLGDTFAYKPPPSGEPTAQGSWTQHTPSPTPGTLTTAGAGYSAGFGGMVTFGGRISTLGTTQNTWRLVVNAVPLADAGSDQVVGEQSSVMLSGTGSDPDGDAITYSWTQVSGPTVTLAGATTATPSFTAPSVYVLTPLEFELMVSDDKGCSAVDRVVVTVQNDVNEPPVADAGADFSIGEGQLVQLDGTGSSDPNEGALTYQWTLVSGEGPVLTGADTATPSFTAPQITGDLVLVYELRVTDPEGAFSADTVTVTITDLGMLPIANAGIDQTVGEGALVELTGEGSSDPDGDPLGYSWVQLSGSPPLTISGADTATPSFTAPAVTTQTVFELELTVSDGRSGSSTDRVLVTVQNTVNEPPVADAGIDQSVGEGALVQLSGAASSDPNGDALGYGWAQISGSPSLSLTGASTATPSFTAPTVTAQTVFELELTVSDGLGGSSTDRVLVTVQNTVNEPPVADAGIDQSVGEGAQVQLTGAASSDPNGDALGYGWAQISGSPSLSLTGASTATPSFTAPTVTAQTVFELELTVTDSLGARATDRVLVTVQNSVNEPPVADAGPDQSVGEGVLVQLSGAASTDPNGDALSYGWAQLSGSPSLSLAGASTATPSFTAPTVTAQATWELELTVTDGLGGSSTDRVLVVVQNTVNEPPVVDAGLDQVVGEGDLVLLDGSGSSDPNGDAFTHFWAQVSGPATLSIIGADTATPSFTAPAVTAQTAFELELTVTDSLGGRATDRVLVTVQNTVNEAPIADAGPDLAADEGAPVQLTGLASVDPNGDTLGYAWGQVSGSPTVSLAGAGTATPSFDAPTVVAQTTLEFELTVSDGLGGSSSDRVLVVVANSINAAPVAEAGEDQVAGEGASVLLDGTASSDLDGDPLAFAWAQVAGSPTVTISGASTASPTFVAPTVVVESQLEFELTVSDDQGGSATDRVVVTIQNSVNEPPIASAGPDQARIEGDLVVLDGSASIDPNGSALVFAWAQVSGLPVTLSQADTAAPSFDAPGVASSEVLVLELTVTDDLGASSRDQVEIAVRPNGLPVADAGEDQRVSEGSVTSLDGSASSDPDGDALTFAWTQLSGPTVSLTGADTATPELTVPAVIIETTLVFELAVGDPRGGQSTDQVQLAVENAIDAPPVANAGPDQVAAEDELLALDGTASFDPEGFPLAYAWTQVSGPAVEISDPTAAAPTARPPTVFVDTDVELELRVVDAFGLQAVDRVRVTVRNTINEAPVAEAGADLVVSETSEVQLDGSGSADPNGDALTYEWTQVSGPEAELSGSDSATPTFTAPRVDAPETIEIELTVRDPAGAAHSDRVQVSVEPIALGLEIGCGCQGGAGLAPRAALGLLALALLRRRRRP